MRIGRREDFDIASKVLGRLVVYVVASGSLFMSVPGDVIPLPRFLRDEEWQDDIVLSILSERFTEVECTVTEQGWQARFLIWGDDPATLPIQTGDTEQEALCRAALAYRARFPRRKVTT